MNTQKSLFLYYVLIIVLFTSYCIIYSYYNCKPTLVYPVFSHLTLPLYVTEISSPLPSSPLHSVQAPTPMLDLSPCADTLTLKA